MSILDDLRLFLQADQILLENNCQPYRVCTTQLSKHVDLVLCPNDEHQIVQAVHTLGKYRRSVHPISCGKNWGYGTAMPPVDGGVVLDLSRMNRIIEVNSELAYCRIEPGVTQGQLSHHIKENYPNLVCDVSGSSPQASIVGLVLERGYGVGPSPERFQDCAGIRVVLPSGKVLETGSARFEESQTRRLHKYGIGPYLDGLFTQSNFGIVSEMTLFLSRKSQSSGILALRLKSDENLGAMIEQLRELMLAGVVGGNVKISNDHKVVVSIPQITAQLSREDQYLSREDTIRNAIKKGQIAKYTAVGIFYGPSDLIRTKLRIASKQFGKISRAITATETVIRRAVRLKGILRRLRLERIVQQIELLEGLLALSSGRPSYFGLDGVYFRRPHSLGTKTQARTYDLIRDHVGLYWFTPMTPLSGKHVLNCIAIARNIFERYGFEFLVTVNTLSPRVACLALSICYDKSSSEESSKALACYHELVRACREAGYLPYRVSPLSYGEFASDSTYDQLVSQIKSAIDPSNSISPSRYGIGTATA